MKKIKTLEVNDFGVATRIAIDTESENKIVNKVDTTYYYADKKYNSYSQWYTINGNTYV
jgi:hypothetical protein